MKKQIKNDMSIYFKHNYPFINKNISNKKYLVTLGIGGNVGNVINRFNILFNMLKSNSRIFIVKTSPILKNKAFGYTNQDDFYNAVMQVRTNLDPYSVLRFCWQYEHRFKRKRSFKDAPRTLDIDILFIKRNFKNISITKENLIVPHKDWKSRYSVTIPLLYI